MTRKAKLELTWIGKDLRPQPEPRVLLPDEAKSHHATARLSKQDLFENRLVFGDNLLALRALEHDFAGKVKCVFIDPPYNTGSAFEHYDDGVEHSLWLSMMRDRLDCLHRLISSDGSVWITIDDNEAHYLKVLLDEIFGRANFVGAVTWQHSVQGKNDAQLISLHHNYVLAYRKGASFRRNLLPRTEEHNVNYANPDADPRGPWRSGDVRSPHYRDNLRYVVLTPSGRTIPPPRNGWRWKRETFMKKVATGEIIFVNDETRVLRKIYLAEQGGRVPESIWFGNDVGTSREASAEVNTLLPSATPAFATPKPEKLLNRILLIATNPGDLVLDSFAGSGTTGAVAHKMGRRWIMIEQGEHCHTHIIPRMRKVIDGQDPGGVTEATGWKGGGGFRYYRVAPSLMEQDRFGNWVLSGKFEPSMLAEAVCKLEGFRYEPSDSVHWMHGRSTESDFIYVTRLTLGPEDLARLSEEVGEQRTLLVMCGAWRCGDLSRFPNLTVRKIPQAVLSRCEWGKDDYSLAVAALPPPDPEADVSAAPSPGNPSQRAPRKRRKSKKKDKGEGTAPLFRPKADT